MRLISLEEYVRKQDVHYTFLTLTKYLSEGSLVTSLGGFGIAYIQRSAKVIFLGWVTRLLCAEASHAT